MESLFGTIAAALLLGFLAGLLAFRIKSRWCPTCGARTFDDRHKKRS